ncbi:peptidoglycan editing factor PgeF [Cardiobacteriaceae bacterium TAE3-ERU3]|nr:peptidoglycan editing factor PgeF [Cardiobacteriaceae bacterium TAE3-ERU3]
MNDLYTQANWPLSLLSGTTRTDHPHADNGFNLARHISCDRMVVEANRQAWLAILDIENVTPMWLTQTHSATVVDQETYQPGIEADAVISRDPAFMPVVLTADCVPILLTNAEGSEVAAIHAGWQGLYQGIIGATIEQMHSSAETLYAWIGPCIRQASYEVDDAFRDRFIALDSKYSAFFSAGKVGHWQADIAAIAGAQLSASGIDSARIFDAGICTFADAGYFSHRRDGALSGRIASFIRPQRANDLSH